MSKRLGGQTMNILDDETATKATGKVTFLIYCATFLLFLAVVAVPMLAGINAMVGDGFRADALKTIALGCIFAGSALGANHLAQLNWQSNTIRQIVSFWLVAGTWISAGLLFAPL